MINVSSSFDCLMIVYYANESKLVVRQRINKLLPFASFAFTSLYSSVDTVLKMRHRITGCLIDNFISVFPQGYSIGIIADDGNAKLRK